MNAVLIGKRPRHVDGHVLPGPIVESTGSHRSSAVQDRNGAAGDQRTVRFESASKVSKRVYLLIRVTNTTSVYHSVDAGQGRDLCRKNLRGCDEIGTLPAKVVPLVALSLRLRLLLDESSQRNDLLLS